MPMRNKDSGLDQSENMGKGENPQITRRTTRSSASAANVYSAMETTTSSDPGPLTVMDLLYGGEHLGLHDLISTFPGRGTQIHELLHLVGPLNSPLLPLFLYGSASTGKTSVVLHTFRHLNRPFVYSSCRSCYSPRLLFESVLNQLLLHRKNADNSYSSAKRCEKPSDFVNHLREGLTSVVEKLSKSPGKSRENILGEQSTGNMVYLIFDNLDLVRDWEKSSTMLAFLFNLYDILKMPEVGLIFISRATPDTYYSSTGYSEPLSIFFSDYTEDNLRQIFMRNQPNPQIYRSFLDVVLKPFCRVTRRVDELASVFASLYKRYCEPLNGVLDVPNEVMKRRLFSHLQPYISPSLNETFSVSYQSALEFEAGKEKSKGKCIMKKHENCGAYDGLDLHISVSAKYLLISAFLASRNRATLDASLFDSTGGSSARKRKRKNSEIAMQRQDMSEQELLLKGPGTFPLERLLAIFQCITSVLDCSIDEELGWDGSQADFGDSSLMSDVLLQLSSLCTANYISKGGSCPLDGSTRYRCTVTEDLALKVARSLKFPLSKYLYSK